MRSRRIHASGATATALSWGTSGLLLAGLLTSGCAFVLDFDQYERDCSTCSPELQCVEGECTRNGCFPRPEENAECKSETAPEAGAPRCAAGAGTLSPHLEFEPLDAELVLQVDVTLTETHVVQTAFVRQASGRHDLVVRSFELDGTVDEPRSPDATFTLSSILSPASGLEAIAPGTVVVTSDASAPLVLYTAYWKPGTATLTGDVVRVELDEMLQPVGTPPALTLTDLPNFQVHDLTGRGGPAAGVLENGEAFVVWQGCRPDPDDLDDSEPDLCAFRGVGDGHGAIYGHSGSDALGARVLATTGIAESLFATSLQALDGASVPAAAWTAASLKTLDVRAGTPTSGVSTSLLQCDGPGAEPLGTNTDSTWRSSWLSSARVWGSNSTLTWTKQLENTDPNSEATALRCTSSGCVDAAPTECPAVSSERLFQRTGYLSHEVLATSSADGEAYEIAAYVTDRNETPTLLATLTRGLADPNQHRLLADEGSLTLSADRPSRVATASRKYTSSRAGVAVTWIEGLGRARLSVLDVCL